MSTHAAWFLFIVRSSQVDLHVLWTRISAFLSPIWLDWLQRDPRLVCFNWRLVCFNWITNDRLYLKSSYWVSTVNSGKHSTDLHRRRLWWNEV